MNCAEMKRVGSWLRKEAGTSLSWGSFLLVYIFTCIIHPPITKSNQTPPITHYHSFAFSFISSHLSLIIRFCQNLQVATATARGGHPSNNHDHQSGLAFLRSLIALSSCSFNSSRDPSFQSTIPLPSPRSSHRRAFSRTSVWLRTLFSASSALR